MTKPSAPRRHLPTSPFAAPVVPTVEAFAVGDQVSHDRFGLGRVVSAEGEVAVLVDFGPHQTRIPSPYKGMSKL
jgi:hypothetical protein